MIRQLVSIVLVMATAILVSTACMAGNLDWHDRMEIRKEYREGLREIARERREMRKNILKADCRAEARREFREGMREIRRERREMRKEIRKELRDRY